ncbi:MAG: MFS transporter [Candidatus Pacearchaeota archaeon]
MKKKVNAKLKREHPIIGKKVEESLDSSIREGAVSSISTGLGASYLAPFAIAMNATSSQIGILNGMIHLIPSLVHLGASNLVEKISSKKIVLYGVLSQVILWLIAIQIGIGFYLGMPNSVWILIILTGALYAVGALIHSAWFFWMGLLVPDHIRGNYFSKRNIIVGLFGLVTMIVAAFFLDWVEAFESSNILFYTIFGFSIIFFFTAFFRFLSWTILRKTYEPKIKIGKRCYFSFWQFIKNGRSTPFGKFAIFRGFFSIAIGISIPFFEFYLLRNLGFSYIWFMAVIASGTFFQLIFLPVLGKVSDKFGNIELTKISAGLIFLVPGLWYLSSWISNPLMLRLYLLFVPSIVSGFAWAGYNLAINNYIYDAVSQKKICLGISYINIIVGVCMFIGTSIGTLIAWVGVPFMDTILFIFLVSTAARLVVFLFGIKHLKEVRPVKKFSSRYLIKEFKPFQEIIKEANYVGHVFEPNHKI